jgi:hypothetical protein
MPHTTHPSSDLHIHYPTNRSSMLLGGAALLVVAGYTLSSALTSALSSPLSWQAFTFLLPLIPGIFCLAAALTTKIQTSAAGIQYFHLGLHASTAWANVERIGPPIRGPSQLKVIHLRTPAHIDWVWHPAGYRERLIQFPLINYDLKTDSPLWRAFQQYAPHILPSLESR